MKSPVTIGVDLGGTSTRIGLYDREMQLLNHGSMATRVAAGAGAVTEEIARCIAELLAANPEFEATAIGIGSPGPLNLRTGVLGLLPNLPGWERFPLRDRLAEATGLPVLLESDANAAAIAEWKLGAGRSLDVASMAMITLGTGVGSGLILNGRVWHGMFGMGGEVGHATVNPTGRRCPCGSRGCLELYASANGLIRLVKEIGSRPACTSAVRELATREGGFMPSEAAELADAGDADALWAFERMGEYLGIGIANLINSLDLPLILVGGGVANAWHLFSPAMFVAVREFSVVYRLAAPQQLDIMEVDRTFIRPASLGPSAGLLGAALLPHLAESGLAFSYPKAVKELLQ